MKTEFDPVTHTYKIDGRVVPSVTQVIRDVLPGWNADEWYLQRGTAIHACAALVAQGKDFECDPQIEGYVQAVRNFLHDHKTEVVIVETQVFSAAYQYAGTLDLLCWMQGALTIVDWKGSLTPSVEWQLAAYALAHPLGEKINAGFCVELHSDGTYKTASYILKKAKNEWMALLTAYRIRQKCKIKERTE